MKERVQKLMATANVGSRRASEQLIEQGRVRVNGQVITLGDKADPEVDVIEVDGQRLRFDKLEKRYIAFYKPKNVVSTSEPHENDDRKTIFDVVPSSEHMFSIGRLDADSEGLMVLTNDGDLANRLTHPSYRHTKTYLVTVQGVPSTQTLDRWQRGIELTEDDGRNVRTAPCVVHMVKKSGSVSVLRVIMTEGKKRQIRRVANALGHPVGKLVRTDIGKLSIEGLKPGEYRDLDEEEVEMLSTPSPEFKISRRPAPRHRTDRTEERPRRSSGERSERNDGDRPRRKPDGEYAARPRREGDSDRPRRSSGERSDRGYKPRTEGDRPHRASSARVGDYKPRGERSEGDRPRRKPDGEHTSRPRREGDSDRPRRSSTERSERSYKPRGERSEGDRPRRPAGKGGAPRSRRDGEGSDRPHRTSSDRPARSSKPQSGRSGSSKPRSGSAPRTETRRNDEEE